MVTIFTRSTIKRKFARLYFPLFFLAVVVVVVVFSVVVVAGVFLKCVLLFLSHKSCASNYISGVDISNV